MVSTAYDDQAGTDYVAMYWFRDPVQHSILQWEQLGMDSVQWGRGPKIPGVRRTLLAFFPARQRLCGGVGSGVSGGHRRGDGRGRHHHSAARHRAVAGLVATAGRRP